MSDATLTQRLARNWWLVAARGAWAVLFGILALAMPAPTLLALVYLFAGFATVSGAFALAAAIVGHTPGSRSWSLVFEGVLGLALGVVTFIVPIATAFALVLMIAAWCIVTGSFAIAAAYRLRREMVGEWWLALNGILAVVFGVLLVAYPVAGALVIAIMIGAYALLAGIVLLMLAWRLYGLHRSAAHVSPRHADAHSPDPHFPVGVP